MQPHSHDGHYVAVFTAAATTVNADSSSSSSTWIHPFHIIFQRQRLRYPKTTEANHSKTYAFKLKQDDWIIDLNV